jgi:two-component system chemotaxis response regulator CheB
MSKVSVMIVEDSPVISVFLEHIISRDPRLQVVASVRSGEEALLAIPKTRPDVISLDIRLPGMNGLEATRRIMSEFPTPIVVVSSNIEDEELKISMNALRTGALAVVQKPVGTSHAEYQNVADSLCTRLFIMSQVRVIRQRYRPQVTALDATGPIPRACGNLVAEPKILGIVASTGGPNALVRVLGDLSPGFPVPIVVVQHITPGFVKGFVHWLNDVIPALEVQEAVNMGALRPGTVYVAPAEYHTVCLDERQLGLQNSPLVSSQRPSGTVLFRSMAKVFRAHAAGVLLTGMGEDGAVGLKEMFDAGACTIAEHESSAVVYGMPGAAVRLGAAREVLPVAAIGPKINQMFQGKTDRHD